MRTWDGAGGPADEDPYLRSTDVIDWKTPEVREQAAVLVGGTPEEVARRCFEWVRDEVRHSRDHACGPATCRASDVLLHHTGYCYAKSHLLAALLRANGLPAGLCYQRLSIGDRGAPYSLHGFNAVLLPETGWYRIDPRGNRPGVDAQFTPPVERLAFPLQSEDEAEFENVFADPLVCVVETLERCSGWEEVLAALPDVPPERFEATGLVVRRRGGG